MKDRRGDYVVCGAGREALNCIDGSPGVIIGNSLLDERFLSLIKPFCLANAFHHSPHHDYRHSL